MGAGIFTPNCGPKSSSSDSEFSSELPPEVTGRVICSQANFMRVLVSPGSSGLHAKRNMLGWGRCWFAVGVAPVLFIVDGRCVHAQQECCAKYCKHRFALARLAWCVLSLNAHLTKPAGNSWSKEGNCNGGRRIHSRYGSSP